MRCTEETPHRCSLKPTTVDKFETTAPDMNRGFAIVPIMLLVVREAILLAFRPPREEELTVHQVNFSYFSFHLYSTTCFGMPSAGIHGTCIWSRTADVEGKTSWRSNGARCTGEEITVLTENQLPPCLVVRSSVPPILASLRQDLRTLRPHFDTGP